MSNKNTEKNISTKSKKILCPVTYYNPATGHLGYKNPSTGKSYQIILKDYDNSGYISLAQ